MQVLTDFTSTLLFPSMSTSSSSQGVSIQLSMANGRIQYCPRMSSHPLFVWLSLIHCSVQKAFIAWFSPVFGHVALPQQPIPLYTFHQGTFTFKVFLGKIFRFIVVFLYEDFNFFMYFLLGLLLFLLITPVTTLYRF